MFLAFGHDNPEEAAVLDPPSDFFRARLICGLLRTCGMFFSKGSAASRLDRFLVFFQLYLFSKSPPPLEITFELQVSSLDQQAWDRSHPPVSKFQGLVDNGRVQFDCPSFYPALDVQFAMTGIMTSTQ